MDEARVVVERIDDVLRGEVGERCLEEGLCCDLCFLYSFPYGRQKAVSLLCIGKGEETNERGLSLRPLLQVYVVLFCFLVLPGVWVVCSQM